MTHNTFKNVGSGQKLKVKGAKEKRAKLRCAQKLHHNHYLVLDLQPLEPKNHETSWVLSSKYMGRIIISPKNEGGWKK